MRGKPIGDLTGQVFGRLTVIGPAPKKGNAATWLCRCACKQSVAVQATKLANGKQKSCGCLNAELRARRVAAFRTSQRRRFLPRDNFASGIDWDESL
jgi:hypothetical protein